MNWLLAVWLVGLLMRLLASVITLGMAVCVCVCACVKG